MTIGVDPKKLSSIPAKKAPITARGNKKTSLQLSSSPPTPRGMIARPTPSRIGGGVRSSMNVASERIIMGGAPVKDPPKNSFALYRKEKLNKPASIKKIEESEESPLIAKI
jgi:hypothetical protein